MKQTYKDRIYKSILKNKRMLLIDSLEKVIRGREPKYIPDNENPQFYEIWFYHPFDFNYIIIGQENFSLNIHHPDDDMVKGDLFEEFKKDKPDSEDPEILFLGFLRELEFDFFSDCWNELEKRLNKNVRCFLIEHGVIRGLDVNNRTLVDGDSVGDILRNEGIPNHH